MKEKGTTGVWKKAHLDVELGHSLIYNRICIPLLRNIFVIDYSMLIFLPVRDKLDAWSIFFFAVALQSLKDLGRLTYRRFL
jgi:hypothetical protein